ncbi:MAG: hypothetical protein ABL995_04570 [Bryobacteraceae bacterium]
MKFRNMQAVIAAGLALQLGMLQAAPSTAGGLVIGTVLAKGSFRLDNATISGNATLFDGGTLETAAASSSVELSTGTRMTLGSASRAKIFGDHLVLERGEGRTNKSTGFHIEARGLRVIPETGNSTARVLVTPGNQVQVASLSGSLRVLNARGVLVANLPQGVALAFEPQTASNASRVIGRLENRGGHYILTDETTNVTLEIFGTDLQKDVGYRVEAIGGTDPAATPISDASQVLRATSVKRLSNSKTVAAGVGGAAGGAAGGTAGGASGIAISGTTIAVIGGAAAAAVLGGLAASGNLSSGEATPVSR